MARSNSSSNEVTFRERMAYNFQLFMLRIKSGNDANDYLREALTDILHYKEIYKTHTGHDLADARVLEIGFGARPFRAFVMQSYCRMLTAVDLDTPAFTLRDCARAWRKNGAERAIKSAVRLSLFDKTMWKKFHEAALKAVPRYDHSSLRLVTADASEPLFWQQNPGPYEFIYSDDVFEHIPGDSLVAVMDLMHKNLAPSGVAVIRPFVFTGISGGHNIEAYPDKVDEMNVSHAWKHLRDPDFKVDTYLNRLSRSWYRREFSKRFDIVADTALLGKLGTRFLTEDVRQQLQEFDDYELFSNKVEFVLIAKKAG
ncbi:MAG: methyltransferase family protein [Tardiphaga sp.]|nr:methyltransferase family protein [Tardiphaga sp.]